MRFMPETYERPMGLPLYWRDEVSGELGAAVEAYFRACLGEEPGPDARQLQILVEYAQHFIGAPCWEANARSCDDEEMLEELTALRERAKALASIESLRRWTCEAMELALDPW